MLADSPEGLYPKGIADALGENASTVRSWLRRLKKDGRITRLADGRYALPREHRKTQAYNPEPGAWRDEGKKNLSPEQRKRREDIEIRLEILRELRDKAIAQEEAEADAEKVRAAFREHMQKQARDAEILSDGLFDPGPGWLFKPPYPGDGQNQKRSSDWFSN